MTTSTRRGSAHPAGTPDAPAPRAAPESPSRQGAPWASLTDGVLDPSLQLGAEEALPPVFPLDDRGTALVLYEGPPGEMRIHWRLERNDFERAAVSFPAGGGGPTAVVRLRRDRPQGGSDQADEIVLGPGVRAGSGERGLRVPADHGRYHAELGLTNADGGWLMLARSNGLYNAVGIGLELVRQPEKRLAGESRRVPSEAGWVAEPGTDRRGGGLAPPVEPALAAGEVPPLDGGFPLVPWDRGGLGGQAPAPGPAGGESGRPLAPQKSTTQGPGAEDSTAAGDGTERIGSAGQGTGSASPSWPAAPVPIPGSGPGGALAQASELDAMRIGVALEPLTYERPPERVNGLELEAELRIMGRARPGSTIDLFGFPYRVGPGGRFQLALPVTDPEILRRALEAAPPAELSGPRED